MTMHIRAATLRPSTLNTEARTVEAIAATGADVARPGFIERLDMTRADMSRLKGGPVLDGHRRESMQDQLGVIEDARITAEGLWVRIRFRQTAAALAVMTDVADGTLRGLSIGYSVEKWDDTQDGKRRIRTATQWTPQEVSLVPVPADPGAHFRHEVAQMETTTQAAPVTLTRAQINTEIRQIADLAGLDRAFADAQIDAEATADAARAAAFAELARTQGQTRTRTATVGTDHTDPAVIATRAGEALFARSHPEHELSPQARAWASLSIPELARDCLRRHGVVTQGMGADTLVTRALHTTSDFPLILADAVNRELRMAYDAAPSGARAVARQTTARDFRLKRKLSVGTAPALEAVGEGGEFKYGTISESQETYRLGTFGKVVAWSRQMQVNDDLGAFQDMSRPFGVQARAFENQTLVNLIIANPVMSDGIAVFNAASHFNQKAAAGQTLASITADLAAARLAMRKQTKDGMLIDVAPRFILVPAELETVMQQALSEVQATAAADVNPFSALTLLVEPRLTSTTQWYAVGDPARIDGLEFAYLEGSPGPQIETRVGFDVDGLQVKVRLDFGAGWIDHRGWYRVG
jgi:HK97 family phage prohead protease